MFATWIVDYGFAFAFGVAFQYFTIAPMRQLSPPRGLWGAIKADALSLPAWQVGMHGFMAAVSLGLFGDGLQKGLDVDSTTYWFMMELAMLCGFATSYPVNWWLISTGIKERM